MFQNTVKRFESIRFEPPLIITGNEYRFIIEDQLNEINVNNTGIIIEPCAKDTAAAILSGAFILDQISLNPLMLILPSDHIFGDNNELISLIGHASSFAEDHIVTFGVRPNRNETGYGWIELSKKNYKNSNLFRVLSFNEKPSMDLAASFLENGNYLWNMGIYLASTKMIIEAFKEHSANLLQLVSASVNKSKRDLNFTRLDETSWNKIDPISIDYAIMEKTSNLLVGNYEYDWDDLGDWNAVWRKNVKDSKGVYSFGPVYNSNCKNSYLRADNPKQKLIALGCEDMIVVSMPDAVLVSKREQTQKIKDAIDHLPKAPLYPIENRQWGIVEILLSEDNVQVSRLFIQPGKSIILQRHIFRAEHWVVLKGTAQIDLENSKVELKENQSIDIPMGTKHSLFNPTDNPLIIIEVQTGVSLDSNDIERFDDGNLQQSSVKTQDNQRT